MNLRNKSWTLLALLCCCGRASAADARAQSGPIQVTLRVHDTTVKLVDHVETTLDTESILKGVPLKGEGRDEVDWSKIDEKDMERVLKEHEDTVRTKINEPVWIQIEVKNAGSEPLIVKDALFDEREDFGLAFKNNMSRSRGTYVEVLGPDGKRLKWTYSPAMIDDCESATPRPGTLSVDEKRRLEAIMDAGKIEGLSKEQLQKRLDSFAAEKGARDRAAASERRRKRLDPGQAVTTPGWIYGGTCGNRKPLPAPVPGYAELWGFKLTKPGRYRMRALYDERPPRTWSKSKRARYLKEAPGAVRVATPEIIFEVKL